MDKRLTISIERRLWRIRGDYLEMPALRFTSAQAQRYWDWTRRAACSF